MRNLIAAAFLIAIILTLAILGARILDLPYYLWAEAHRIPECQEDAVLIGAGDFQNGTWDYYVCGPAVDDYPPLSH